MKKINIKLTYIDELLGTASADPDIHARFIASKAPDAPSRHRREAQHAQHYPCVCFFRRNCSMHRTPDTFPPTWENRTRTRCRERLFYPLPSDPFLHLETDCEDNAIWLKLQ